MINKFTAKYYFLSLKSPFKYTLYSIPFNNLEQYYFAFKCNFIQPMLSLVNSKRSPEEFISRLPPDAIRPDWYEVREKILNHGVYRKFGDPKLQQYLLETKDEELVYGFEDENPSEELLYLGRSLITGEGQNQLGKQLMWTRQYYTSLKIHTLLNVASEYAK